MRIRCCTPNHKLLFYGKSRALHCSYYNNHRPNLTYSVRVFAASYFICWTAFSQGLPTAGTCPQENHEDWAVNEWVNWGKINLSCDSRNQKTTHYQTFKISTFKFLHIKWISKRTANTVLIWTASTVTSSQLTTHGRFQLIYWISIPPTPGFWNIITCNVMKMGRKLLVPKLPCFAGLTWTEMCALIQKVTPPHQRQNQQHRPLIALGLSQVF